MQKRRVAHLDDKKRVARGGMSMLVTAFARCEKRNVGQRLGIFATRSWALTATDRVGSRGLPYEFAHPVYYGGMHRPDWWHVEDLSIDQFDACIRREQPYLRHAVVLRHSNAMPARPFFHFDTHG